MLAQARNYRTSQLDKAFGIDRIYKNYERIANKIIQIQAGNSDHLLEDLKSDINLILNYKLESLGNPTKIQGYAELCDIYKKLNSFYVKELASLHAQVESSEIKILKSSQGLSSVNSSISSPSSTARTEVFSETSPTYMKDSFLKTQLLMSPMTGIASLLLESNASLEEHQKYYTPLLSPDRESYGWWKAYLEAVKSNPPLLKQLLAICDHRKNTILHRTAKAGNVENLKFILSLSPDLEQWNLQGNTALHEAVIGMGDETDNQLATVRILIESGANLCALAGDTVTVLIIAVEKGHWNILQFLLSQKIDPTFLEQGDSDGKRALHKAVWGDPKPAIVRALIEKGADVNGRNHHGFTPLHWAAKHGHLESAQVLLEHGADQTIGNNYMDLPIDLALKFGQDRAARLLIDPTMEFSSCQNLAVDEQNIEGSYYSHFERAYERGDALEQLLSLEKLADHAVTAKEYEKAAHFLNSAYAAAVLHHFASSYQRLLLKKMERIEGLFLEPDRKTPAAHKNYLLRLRLNIDKARDQAMVCLRRGNPIKSFQADLTGSFKKFLSELIESSIELFGQKPPTSFAVIGLGSMSRDEMCPCSGVKFAFLIQEDIQESKKYFQKLTRFLHLRIINLGETTFAVIPPSK